MHRLISLLMACVLLISTASAAETAELPVIDFQRYFPHFVAVSEEINDKDFPPGTQYKFVVVRDEQDKVVFVTLTRREGEKRVVRVFLARGPLDGSEEALRSSVKKFSDKAQVRFEIFDLRDIRTYTDFEARSAALGWGMQVLPK